MNDVNKNKEFVLEYFNALSGTSKPPEKVNLYVEDEELRSHIVFFEAVFPKYELFADEMTAEGNRVVVKAHCKGRHEGEFKGIPPTHKLVQFDFVICYTIEHGKIVNHWMNADMASLMEQFGVSDLATV